MTPISIQYAYRIFADPFINHTNYCSLSPPALEAPRPLLSEIRATPGSKLIVRTYLHLSTAEGRGFLLLGRHRQYHHVFRRLYLRTPDAFGEA